MKPRGPRWRERRPPVRRLVLVIRCAQPSPERCVETRPVMPAAAPLSETSISCPDHPCDGCHRCRRQRCCRQDRPDFPRFGDWTEPIFGQLGALTVDEDNKVVCHVCGQAYRALDNHARQAHDLWPEEYRVLFGLERGRALQNPTLSARRRELAEDQLRPWREQVRALAAGITPEQRAAWSRGKTRRLETLQDPDNRARWREAGRRGRQTRRARIAAGHREGPQGVQAGTAEVQVATARGRARRQELLADPVYRAELGRRMSEAKAAREPVSCSVCGAVFTSPRSWLRRGYGTLCSAACREQWKLQRGRGRNGQPWQQVAEQLRLLGPSILDALPPPAPEIVRRFYGLVDGTPWTQQGIAAHLGLTKARVQHILTGTAVSRLLGEPGHRLDRRRVTAACAVCGVAVERAPQELRDRVQTMCGPACRLAWQRQQAVARLNADPTIRARRLERLRQATATPTFSESARQAALHRARPHAEALRALSAEAFARPDGRDRDLLCRYYGLGGAPPETQRALAAGFHLAAATVRQRIAHSVAQLLGGAG